MANYNNRKLDIVFLIKELYSVLEIEVGEKSCFFITNDFEPPTSGAINSAQYLQFTGKDITEFIENSSFNQANEELYKSRLEQFLQKIKEINYKFSVNHLWRHYG